MDNSTHLISEKSETNNSNNEVQKISMCGIMKDNTSGIIQKLELVSPILFQNYSELYSRYLHSIQDLFGACNLAEKQYFDNMPIDQNILKIFDYNWKFMTNIAEFRIDLSTDFLKSYVQFRLSLIDSWVQYAHTALNTYAKTLSEFIQK